MQLTGALSAILAAALFGASPAFAKLWIGELPVAIFAGLLYLGSGLGLGVIITWNWIRRKKNPFHELSRLSLSHRLKLIGAIVAGGILAPLAFAAAIKLTSAFEVSLLLNLETVTTTAIAAVVFREHVGRRVWTGILILIGAATLAALGGPDPVSADGVTSGTLSRWGGVLMAIAACAFWGLDNNLTRDVESLPASVLAGIRGLTAGAFNLALGIVLAPSEIPATLVRDAPPALLIGAVCYGISLVFMVDAFRAIGAARTAAYFASGPFFGMFFSLVLLPARLQPPPSALQWIAAAIAALAIWILHREHHEHLHTHESLHHSHAHVHAHVHAHPEDDHHQHEHAANEPGEAVVPGQPHVHFHRHQPVTHAHAHKPDIHHRHGH